MDLAQSSALAILVNDCQGKIKSFNAMSAKSPLGLAVDDPPKETFQALIARRGTTHKHHALFTPLALCKEYVHANPEMKDSPLVAQPRVLAGEATVSSHT